MDLAKSAVLLSLIAILGVPFVFALTRAGETPPPDARSLTVITPHNEQIRKEFARAFNEWHQANHGQPVVIDWRQPGGTSTIRKQLQSIYTAAIRDGKMTPQGQLATDENGQPLYGTMPNDIFFGGGSYEHGQMKQGVTATPPDANKPVNIPISVPIDIEQNTLAAIFGDNAIGSTELYDEDLYWIGTALSGFGIVYNRDVLNMLDLPEPQDWHDLTHPRYTGWIALADPRNSGSVTTTYDSILNIYGWEEGWKILKDMCANARYFANTATKIPIDVSIGEAAAGVAIDFYGRYQSQAFMTDAETPETARVGYSYPIRRQTDGTTTGAVLIDPDPVSILRGAPDPELAHRFVDFLLSQEGQSIWQYHAATKIENAEPGSHLDTLPHIPNGFGPDEYELRRLPIRRDMYTDEHTRFFVDKETTPFTLAEPIPYRGWRSSIAPLMVAMAIANHNELVDAWEALNQLRDAAERNPSLAEPLAELERIFYAFPTHTFPEDSAATDADGNPLAATTVTVNGATFRPIRSEIWQGRTPQSHQRIRYLNFFKDNYQTVENRARRLLNGES